jgi:Lipase (class 3)
LFEFLVSLRTFQCSLLQLAIKLFSRESVEAVKTIQSILSDVHEQHGVVDVFGKYRPYDILAAVFALSRLQNAALIYERRTAGPPSPEIVPDNDENKALLRDLAHYALYANAVYGWKMELAMHFRLHMGGNVQALLRLTGVKRDDIILTKWESKTHQPAYFLVRDRSHKTLVLCIRGTRSAHDLLTDLCCTPQDFEHASWSNSSTTAKTLSSAIYYSAEDLYTRATKRRRCGHYGMLEAARAVQNDSEAVIAKELEENPDYALVLVGHSMGGGVAALLGTLLERSYPNLRVYLYGAPCVAPANAKLHRNIISVVTEGDPFRCLSLGHIADLSTGLASLCEDPLLRNDILMRTNAPVDYMEDADLEWCFDTMETLRTKMTAEKLFPPGRILLLTGAQSSSLLPWRRSTNCKSSASLREVPPQYFRDLVVGPQMVDLLRHFPSLYESTLRALANS